MASRYEISSAGSAGKGVFSTTKIGAGDVIFELQRPLVTALDTPALEYACEWCFDGIGEAALGQQAIDQFQHSGMDTGEVKLLRCTGCRLVKYCSKTCQAQAWKHHHKVECKIFGSFMPRVIPNAGRMLVQLLLRKNKGLFGATDWASFIALQHHIDDFRRTPPEQGDLNRLRITAMVAREYGGMTESVEQVEMLAARIFVNAQTLVNPIYHPLGQCLDPLPSTINHSCMPNAVIVFSGPVMTLKATNEIAKGDEITISYIDNTTPPAMRQLELKERYFFNCKCSSCSNHQTCGRPDVPVEWFREKGFGPIKKSLLDLDDAGLGHLQNAEHALRASRVGQSTFSTPDDSVPSEYYLALCKGLSLYLQQENLDAYPPGRQPLARLRSEVVIELLSRNLFLPALLLSLQSYYDDDPVHFPFVCHPVRVVHAYTLSKLAHHIHYLDCTNDRAVEAMAKYFDVEEEWADVSYALFGEVVTCIWYSHGEENRLTKQVRGEALVTLQVPRAAKLIKGTKIGPQMGLRDPAAWRKVKRVAREGWGWYRRWVGEKEDRSKVDEGIKILVQEAQASTVKLLRPQSA